MADIKHREAVLHGEICTRNAEQKRIWTARIYQLRLGGRVSHDYSSASWQAEGRSTSATLEFAARDV
jgi:hypothetical protein